MNKCLNVQLILNSNCTLLTIDHTNYTDLEIDLQQHVVLEFLSYNEDPFPLIETIKLNESNYNCSKFSSEFILSKDGTHSYYKLVIPTLDHFKTSDNKYTNLYQEVFFYNGIVYKSNISNTELEYNLDFILLNSEEITNYIEIYELIQNNKASQTLYCPKEKIFSICKLQRCLVSLQRQLLFSGINNCGYNECNTDKDLRNRRDFLLGALYVFDYLKDIGNFMEAQRILDNLSTCYSICGEDLMNLNDCGCGCGNFI